MVVAGVDAAAVAVDGTATRGRSEKAGEVVWGVGGGAAVPRPPPSAITRPTAIATTVPVSLTVLPVSSAADPASEATWLGSYRYEGNGPGSGRGGTDLLGTGRQPLLRGGAGVVSRQIHQLLVGLADIVRVDV